MAQPSEAAMKQPTQAPWEEMASIVRAENIRPATPADSIEGVGPTKIVEPETAEELAKVLACANRAGLAVIPRGGGTKLDWGYPPRRADLILSTAGLNKLLEHAWGDMTATVQAGCRVSAFQRTLAEHGQRLALDPLWPERATIGGILATNDSGALRTRFGSLRDLVIGITLALPDGTLAKSGGKVVKNVAGYDLPKLATGSLGTLGVITEAVFRLHPLPHETQTLSFTAPTFEVLCELANAIRDSKLACTCLQLQASSTGEPLLDATFEGTRAGLEAQEKALLQLAAKATRTDSLGAANAHESLWQSESKRTVAKFSVLPADLARFCAMAAEIGSKYGLTWQAVAQAVGVGHLRLETASDDDLLAALRRLRSQTELLGGTLVVLRCPLEIKPQFDVWGSPGNALSLMQRMKQQLDPVGTLNPGRFVGGI